MVLLREREETPKSKSNGFGTGCASVSRSKPSTLSVTGTRVKVSTKMDMEQRDQNHNHLPIPKKTNVLPSKSHNNGNGTPSPPGKTPLYLKQTQASLNRTRGVLTRQDALVMKSSKESLSGSSTGGTIATSAKSKTTIKSPLKPVNPNTLKKTHKSPIHERQEKGGGGGDGRTRVNGRSSSPKRNVPLSFPTKSPISIMRAQTREREQEEKKLQSTSPLVVKKEMTTVQESRKPPFPSLPVQTRGRERASVTHEVKPKTPLAPYDRTVKKEMLDTVHSVQEPLQFIVPLEENIEVVEGSELELWVKLKGAVSVVWVKGDKVLPHFPPYFLHSVNPAQGIFSIKIRDIFLQDEGIYVCEAYGQQQEDKVCWTRVKVIEETEAETESILSSGSVSEPALDPQLSRNPPPPSVPRRDLVIPEIKIVQDEMEEEARRGELRRSSGSSFEEPLEDIHEEDEEEVEAEPKPEPEPIPPQEVTLTSPEIIEIKGHEDPEQPPEEWTDVPLKKSDPYNTYQKHEQLGKGRFGIVFKLQSYKTSEIFAGKVVKCRKSSDKERALLEYKIMNHLRRHEKLITLTDAFEQPREVVIVTDLIPGGELFELVVSDAFTLTEQDCVSFLRQICDGVAYIHSRNVIHLDLKPENILCTFHPESDAPLSATKIKIIDFGLAQFYSPIEELRVLFGTPEFVAPEVIAYEVISPATDMWSVGVITYILLSGLSPFLGDSDPETFNNITAAELVFEDEAFTSISSSAKDFISSLIVKRKETRLTAEGCLLHPWLQQEESQEVPLRTDKLKRFLLRRKWQKTGNAIRALGRITTLYSRRSSSEKSSVGGGGGSFGSGFGGRSFSQEEGEEEVFAEGRSNSNNSKAYLDESCRSDSGIGGENYNSLEQGD